MRAPLISFESTPITGSGRGKTLNVPTINLDLSRVPSALEEGIYACVVELNRNGEMLAASMHYGPRPVFKDSLSCEVHLLDRAISEQPQNVLIHIIERLRDVQDFPSPGALVAQIAEDNARAHAILEGA